MIVAGAHGMSGSRAGIAGQRVDRPCSPLPPACPSRPATSAEEDIEGPLLLCFDGSDASKRAIATAGELLDPQPAVVFHFWDSWVAEAPALAALSRTVEGMATELDEVAAEQSCEAH